MRPDTSANGTWEAEGTSAMLRSPPNTASMNVHSFEGLGDRVLPPGRLSEQNEKLGRGKSPTLHRAELTELYVDRSIAFIDRSVKAKKPFYIHLWPNDVHDPFTPKPELMKKYQRYSSNLYLQQYFATIDELDHQTAACGLTQWTTRGSQPARCSFC